MISSFKQITTPILLKSCSVYLNKENNLRWLTHIHFYDIAVILQPTMSIVHPGNKMWYVNQLSPKIIPTGPIHSQITMFTIMKSISVCQISWRCMASASYNESCHYCYLIFREPNHLAVQLGTSFGLYAPEHLTLTRMHFNGDLNELNPRVYAVTSVDACSF